MDKDEPRKPVKTETPENIKSMSTHRGLAIFYGLMGLGFLVLFGSGSEGWSIFGPVLILLVIAGIHGAIAIGAARAAPWARVGSIIVACLMLLGFPIGTLIGAYLLANLKWPKKGRA